MSSMRFVLAGSLVVLAACGDAEPPAVDATVTESTAQDLDSVVISAIEAHRAGDYDRAVELSLQAEAMLPNHPRLLFNTACAMALSGDTEAALDRLERAHHLYREPTLGTVVGDDLIYVAASQWRSFDEEGHLLRDQLVEPTILRLPLTD